MPSTLTPASMPSARHVGYRLCRRLAGIAGACRGLDGNPGRSGDRASPTRLLSPELACGARRAKGDSSEASGHFSRLGRCPAVIQHAWIRAAGDGPLAGRVGRFVAIRGFSPSTEKGGTPSYPNQQGIPPRPNAYGQTGASRCAGRAVSGRVRRGGQGSPGEGLVSVAHPTGSASARSESRQGGGRDEAPPGGLGVHAARTGV